jgi:trk system potassium uptake protein
MIAATYPVTIVRLSPLCFSAGVVILIFSAAMLVPLGVAGFGDRNGYAAFRSSFWLTGAVGLLLAGIAFKGPKNLSIRDSYVLVTGIWSGLPVFAALPFLIYFPDMSFTDAYFEAVAGLTTTGATVFTNLDGMPASILIWRALLQWLGGIGIIVLFVALLPLLRVGGRQLYKAEMPGAIKETQVTPRIAETAKGLWIVYTAMTALCVVAYRLAGMSWFDAVAHAFTTLSLGGFSTHDASYGHFDSPLIEAVAITFMLVAGINFATHFVAMSRRTVQPYRADREVSWFLAAILGGVAVVATFLWIMGAYDDFTTSLRYAAFNVVSIGTTTGYSSADYNAWPLFAPILMLLLAATSASAGSTGGGIKMIRTQLLLKQVHRELVRMLHPSAVVPIRIGAEAIPTQVVVAVLGFMTVYGACIMVFALLLLASGLELVTAFAAVIACITGTGPGLAEVGPAATYAGLNDFQTWVLAIAMILGRLEVFTVLVLFSPAFWRR